MTDRPPFPPFTNDVATQKTRMAEDAWNTRNPDVVIGAYTEGSVWRNRSEFITGHREIHAWLTKKWAHEQEYRLIKELWCTGQNRIAVRFAMNGVMSRGNGFAPMGMKIGNSPWMAGCVSAVPASTICGSPRMNGCFIGLWAAAQMITQALPT